jgi:hypothetical protein
MVVPPVTTENRATAEAAEAADSAAPRVAAIIREVLLGPVAGLIQRARDVLERIVLCRTPPLGTRSYQCQPCAQTIKVNNSCGERHCPLCSGHLRIDWLQRTVRWLVPQTSYLQVVFTIPGAVADLLWQSRKAGYDMLMKTGWREVKRWLGRIGVQAGAIVVLHTWSQRLGHHPHLHVLIPAAGVSTDGSHWIDYRNDPLLAPGNQWELGRQFRKSIIRRIKRLQKHGKLQLAGELARLNDPAALADHLAKAAPDGYRVYFQHPPSGSDDPQVVLKYLARYVSGGPISDRRIVSHSGGEVTFLARPEKRSKDGKPQQQVPVTLPEEEFVRRWSLHILPKGFIRVRHCGQLSAKRRKGYLARCRELLGIEEEPDEEPLDAASLDSSDESPEELLPEDQEEDEVRAPSYRCPSCDQPMTCTQFDHRPSWKLIMAWRQLEEHQEWFET